MQDAHSCFTPSHSSGNVLAWVLSDGAGSASLGGQGASLICRSIGSAILRHYCDYESLPAVADIEEWVDGARDHIFAVAQHRAVEAREFAATLLVGVSDGNGALFAHVGDGAIVVRSAPRAPWEVASWPEHGEYASTTDFVTDKAGVKLRIVPRDVPIQSIIAFTDGLERLALDFSAERPFDGFLNAMEQPLLRADLPGRDRALSDDLNRFLASARVTSRTDDDKTLVAAIRL